MPQCVLGSKQIFHCSATPSWCHVIAMQKLPRCRCRVSLLVLSVKHEPGKHHSLILILSSSSTLVQAALGSGSVFPCCSCFNHLCATSLKPQASLFAHKHEPCESRSYCPSPAPQLQPLCALTGCRRQLEKLVTLISFCTTQANCLYLANPLEPRHLCPQPSTLKKNPETLKKPYNSRKKTSQTPTGCRRQLEKCSPEDPDTMVNTGCILFKEGQYEVARTKFNEAISSIGYQVRVTLLLAFELWRPLHPPSCPCVMLWVACSCQLKPLLVGLCLFPRRVILGWPKASGKPWEYLEARAPACRVDTCPA